MPAIMVPLDGSAFAEQALPLALALARRTDATLQLVAVRASFADGPVFDRTESYLRVLAGQLENTLPGTATPWVLNCGSGTPYTPPPSSSDIAHVLARHASSHDIDVIVMTTHGRGGMRRAWLGSVADSLTRLATRPVLLVRPEETTDGVAAAVEPAIAHVLVPLDGSASAEQAIPAARHLGAAFNARYTLLRVVTPLSQQLSARGRDMYWAAHESPSSRPAAMQYLEKTAAGLRDEGLMVDTVAIDSTSPGPAIIDWAGMHEVDVIAMSTAGAGGVKRLLLGSVADKIVRSAVTPVLVCNERRVPGAAEPVGAAQRNTVSSTV
jgi:nucleotide-binding universal stress UspA family protein